MSSANMWSDEEDGSSRSSLSGGGTGGSASSYSEHRWQHPLPASETTASKSTNMETDDDTIHDLQGLNTPTQPPPFYHNYISDDDDDDDMVGGAGAPVDILAVTSVLSQGIGLDDDDDDDGEGFAPGPPMIPSLPYVANHQPPVIPGQHAAGFQPYLLGSPVLVAGHHFNFEHAQISAAPTIPAIVPNQTQHIFQPPPEPHGGLQQSNDDDDEEEDDIPATIHHPGPNHGPVIPNPPLMSNFQGAALGPDNSNLFAFLRAWQTVGWQSQTRERGRYPWLDKIDQQISRNFTRVDYMDLEGDRCDVQGIDWDDLGVTRGEARERRLNTYKNYVNVVGSDRWEISQSLLPCTDNFFRFRHLDIRKNISLAHFQLRSVLASNSRSQVFYPSQYVVNEFNPMTGRSKLGMRSKEIPHFQVSTLAADYDTLIAGGFFGEYCFRRLSSESNGEVHEGTITPDNSGITNHVQLHLSRTSSSPRAAFACNDRGFRVLDIETERFVAETILDKPINCSAISPDRRLRVMVGDQTQVLITKAEADGQPEILQSLDGHGDFGFACDWADDGWTVATGFQDKSVKIWDARRWTDSKGHAAPVATLRSEIAGVRSLRFSPLGSGKRVLVAAEEADFVNIYDARTFQSKQTFDFIGEIGGTAFVNEGQDLHILCCDRNRGGLFTLERCGAGAERHYDPEDLGMRPYDRRWKNGSYDWQESRTTPRRLPRSTETRRRRRALATSFCSLEPF